MAYVRSGVMALGIMGKFKYYDGKVSERKERRTCRKRRKEEGGRYMTGRKKGRMDMKERRRERERERRMRWREGRGSYIEVRKKGKMERKERQRE